MPVGTLATEDVQTTDRDASVRDVAKQMAESGVGSIVVVEDEKPVGIVTDRSIALAVGEHDDLGSLTVEDVMASDVATIQEDAEDMELPRMLGEEKVRRLPVVDSDGKLTGIVSLDDLVSTIGEEMEEVANVIEAQSPGYSPDEE